MNTQRKARNTDSLPRIMQKIENVLYLKYPKALDFDILAEAIGAVGRQFFSKDPVSVVDGSLRKGAQAIQNLESCAHIVLSHLGKHQYAALSPSRYEHMKQTGEGIEKIVPQKFYPSLEKRVRRLLNPQEIEDSVLLILLQYKTLSISKLGRALNMNKCFFGLKSISGGVILKDMRERGLLEFARISPEEADNPISAKTILISLTEKGREKAQELLRQGVKIAERVKEQRSPVISQLPEEPQGTENTLQNALEDFLQKIARFYDGKYETKIQKKDEEIQLLLKKLEEKEIERQRPFLSKIFGNS